MYCCLQVYLTSQIPKIYVMKLENESKWANSCLHGTFLSWDVKYKSLFTQLKMVDCTVICYIFVVLKLLSLFFPKSLQLMPKCGHWFAVVDLWLGFISPLHTACYARAVNISSLQVCINVYFKSKQKQVIRVVQGGHHRLFSNKFFSN